MQISKIEQNSNPLIPQNFPNIIEMFDRIKEQIKYELEICVPAKVISKNGSYVTVQPLPNIRTNAGSFIQRKPVTVKALGSSNMSSGSFGYLISGDVPQMDINGNFSNNTYDPSDGECHTFSNGFFLSINNNDSIRKRINLMTKFSEETGRNEYILGGFDCITMKSGYDPVDLSTILPYPDIPETSGTGLVYISDLYNQAKTIYNKFGDSPELYTTDGYVIVDAVIQVTNWSLVNSEYKYSIWPKVSIIGHPTINNPTKQYFGIPALEFYNINDWDIPRVVTVGGGTDSEINFTIPPYTQWYNCMAIAYNPTTRDAYVYEDRQSYVPTVMPFMRKKN